MDVEKYDSIKWKKIMDTTQINYSNMVKRLTRKSKISNFALIYYSIFLIISSLTCKYFPTIFNCKLADYFNIILSVIVLAYSLINNNANYSIRIANIENSLNQIKNIKRELDKDNLKDNINKYIEITDKTERREDVDFFITIKELKRKYKRAEDSKKNNEQEDREIIQQKKAVDDYLSEINVGYQILKILLEFSWYVILMLIPIVVFLICIICKH